MLGLDEVRKLGVIMVKFKMGVAELEFKVADTGVERGESWM